MEIILLLIRIFLFGVFILAGIGKLLDLRGAEKAVENFGIPKNLAKPLAVVLPVTEILIALLLLASPTARFGAFGAFALLAAFTGGMIWQMRLGNAPDCHCFGQIHSEPVSSKTLARTGVFAVLSAIVLIFGAGAGLNELSNEAALQLFIGTGVIILLAATIFYLKKISEQQTQILRRMEVLEIVSSEGAEKKRDDVHAPHDGLPIGAPAPDFELPDASGKLVSFEHLLIQGKPTLLFFVSPSCNPCRALVPEIEKWHEELAEEINFVFITSGDARENLEKFGAANPEMMLLQKEKKVSQLFSAPWTPTAIFLNAEGIISSHPAAGDAAIRELVESVKNRKADEKFFYAANGNGFSANPPKVGEKVPEFSLEDLQGNSATDEILRGKRTLIAFFSTTCPHCVAMQDDLREWQRTKGADAPDLLIFSDGEPEQHREFDLNAPILLDKGYQTSRKLGMSGTPSAVLINEDGIIISETAIGAAQIWSLVGRRK